MHTQHTMDAVDERAQLESLELQSLSSGRAIAGVALPAIVLNGEN